MSQPIYHEMNPRECESAATMLNISQASDGARPAREAASVPAQGPGGPEDPRVKAMLAGVAAKAAAVVGTELKYDNTSEQPSEGEVEEIISDIIKRVALVRRANYRRSLRGMYAKALAVGCVGRLVRALRQNMPALVRRDREASMCPKCCVRILSPLSYVTHTVFTHLGRKERLKAWHVAYHKRYNGPRRVPPPCPACGVVVSCVGHLRRHYLRRHSDIAVCSDEQRQTMGDDAFTTGQGAGGALVGAGFAVPAPGTALAAAHVALSIPLANPPGAASNPSGQDIGLAGADPNPKHQ